MRFQDAFRIDTLDTKVIIKDHYQRILNSEKTFSDDNSTFIFAPSFRSRNTLKSVQQMDDNLKLIILGTTKAIAGIPPEDRTWQNIVATLQNASLIEPCGEEINESYKRTKQLKGFIKFDGSPNPDIVNEVETWIQDLISGNDILDATMIDAKEPAKTLAQSGAATFKLGLGLPSATFYTEESRETVCEIGVLRYPDNDHPYFKLFRIKVLTLSSCRRVFLYQHDNNSVTIDLVTRRYKPRVSILDMIKKETRLAAVKEAESLLLGLENEKRRVIKAEREKDSETLFLA
ncbi:hypothetical protein BDN72DRAFT_849801 [Pluteus cervinus]|uniref:Uncharacterized protein n=1 Tax=Pluteus cervinus TaxID=181527 RepID=A0ACD3A6L7_9AGAR|nr:hypothetical protein BDN72DRAFT_849801 [Pluteus cervinus]